MKIVIYTGTSTSLTSKYINTELLKAFPEAVIVAVNVRSLRYRLDMVKIQLRKIRKKGIRFAVKKLSDRKQLAQCLSDWQKAFLHYFNSSKPGYSFSAKQPDHIVPDTNGKVSEKLLKQLEPDIIIQNGAGHLLAENIFSVASLATLNMHHGIAPKIRGGHSIFWGIYHKRPDWVGVTIHKIDKGIDTGAVMARKEIPFTYGDHPAKVFTDATIEGTSMLIEVIARMRQGDLTTMNTVGEKSTYKSFYSPAEYLKLKSQNWIPS